MKKAINITIFAIIVILSLSGCNDTPKEKVMEASAQVVESTENLNMAKEDLKTEIENYRFATIDKLLTNESNLIRYKDEIANEKTAIKKIYEERIRKLEDNNLKLKNKLSSYPSDDKSNWEEFKSELDKEVQSTADDISKLLKKDN
jgi:hypothetical protein